MVEGEERLDSDVDILIIISDRQISERWRIRIEMKRNIWFTSDTHFNHRNIISYAQRPFESVEEMNKVMIERWNALVRDEDTIYHLGDFSFGGPESILRVLQKLKGRIHLCMGSHDKQLYKIRNRGDVCSLLVGMEESYIINFHVEKIATKVFLSHYCHKVWPFSHYGSWHLFGHSHGKLDAYAADEGRMLDVGVDSHDFYPWSLGEVAGVMKTRPINFNQISVEGSRVDHD